MKNKIAQHNLTENTSSTNLL